VKDSSVAAETWVAAEECISKAQDERYPEAMKHWAVAKRIQMAIDAAVAKATAKP
jgi:hypothetical protein